MTKRSQRKRPKQLDLPLKISGHSIHKALRAEAPEVYQLVTNDGDDFISLRIAYRGENDYLAIGKRYGDDGTPQVIFGSGIGLATCLVGLAVAIDQNKWRPDKFVK